MKEFLTRIILLYIIFIIYIQKVYTYLYILLKNIRKYINIYIYRRK